MKARVVSAVVLLAGHSLVVDAGGVYNTTVAHKGDAKVMLKSVQAHAAQAGASRIVPPLENVASDKKFFGPPFPADYPDDVQPPAKKKLFEKRAMYPKVQEEGFFDKDYVKDENSDGGKWQAQMDYDTARTRIAREKRQAENAAKRAQNERHDVDQAANEVAKRKKEEDEAAKAAREADEAASSARADAKEETAKRAAERRAAAEKKAKAEQEEDERRREEERKALQKKVDEAEDDLKKEKDSYKDCLKELQDTKAAVEKLKQQRDDMQNAGNQTTKLVKVDSRELEAEKKALTEAKARTAEAEEKHRIATANLAEAAKASEEAKHKLDRQKAENEAALKKIKEQEKELQKAEKDLADSRTNLRQIRGIDAVPGQSHDQPAPPQKSDSHIYKAPLALLAVVVVSAIS